MGKKNKSKKKKDDSNGSLAFKFFISLLIVTIIYIMTCGLLYEIDHSKKRLRLIFPFLFTMNPFGKGYDEDDEKGFDTKEIMSFLMPDKFFDADKGKNNLKGSWENSSIRSENSPNVMNLSLYNILQSRLLFNGFNSVVLNFLNNTQVGYLNNFLKQLWVEEADKTMDKKGAFDIIKDYAFNFLHFSAITIVSIFVLIYICSIIIMNVFINIYTGMRTSWNSIVNVFDAVTNKIISKEKVDKPVSDGQAGVVGSGANAFFYNSLFSWIVFVFNNIYNLLTFIFYNLLFAGTGLFDKIYEPNKIDNIIMFLRKNYFKILILSSFFMNSIQNTKKSSTFSSYILLLGLVFGGVHFLYKILSTIE